MPISQLLKSSKYSPEEIELLDKAFDHALGLLGVLDRDDPLCKMVARDVIAIGTTGTNDSREIAEKAVARMGLR
ncbi:hypothetical protein IC762_30195 [Bradyrhizobium genosp. L]|uniref:hypothetical protein n=1 Tax=Bradyrhizobium genosp. L TaxID=83637 RepID=UPI0018A264F3|nr:hypothetical protein [Bradyrhizobium genosp. L]QPF83891.1 hypothetical protein IC762_30195 [Bradyrhizobium genosp. L]